MVKVQTRPWIWSEYYDLFWSYSRAGCPSYPYKYLLNITPFRSKTARDCQGFADGALRFHSSFSSEKSAGILGHGYYWLPGADRSR